VVTAQEDSSRDEIRLLVRSDDMGAVHAVNQACIETVTKGIARSVEVIVPAPWFLEAAALLKNHPTIDVGVHLDLTSEWSLV
jgi:chitin disaccharide deacetylase